MAARVPRRIPKFIMMFEAEGGDAAREIGILLKAAEEVAKKWREENPKTNSSDLLKKINVEKAELIKSKNIKKENFEILSDDQLIEIPKNSYVDQLIIGLENLSFTVVLR